MLETSFGMFWLNYHELLTRCHENQSILFTITTSILKCRLQSVLNANRWLFSSLGEYNDDLCNSSEVILKDKERRYLWTENWHVKPEEFEPSVSYNLDCNSVPEEFGEEHFRAGRIEYSVLMHRDWCLKIVLTTFQNIWVFIHTVRQWVNKWKLPYLTAQCRENLGEPMEHMFRANNHLWMNSKMWSVVLSDSE